MSVRPQGLKHWLPVAGATALGVLVVAICLLPGGCGPRTRYRVLAFFFDGVPDPNADPDQDDGLVPGPWGLRLDPSHPLAQEQRRSQAAASPAAEAPAFLHRPYRDRQCMSCHEREGSFQAPQHDGQLCRGCHGEYYSLGPDDWTHGPVALGGCALCHEPHQAPREHLLSAPQPELCFQCHDPQRTSQLAVHALAGTSACSDCHDPHVAGNRLLLVDGASLRRRRPPNLPLPAGHAGWDRQQCNACHLPQRSNQLTDNVDQVCLSCHEDLPAGDGGGPVHQAVTDGRCTACHTPHATPRPHLIRPVAEQMCYQCHTPGQLDTPGHPPVRRADCLQCHHGHQAQRDHLLRPEVGQRRAEQAVPEASGALGGPAWAVPGM